MEGYLFFVLINFINRHFPFWALWSLAHALFHLTFIGKSTLLSCWEIYTYGGPISFYKSCASKTRWFVFPRCLIFHFIMFLYGLRACVKNLLGCTFSRTTCLIKNKMSKMSFPLQLTSRPHLLVWWGKNQFQNFCCW